MALALNVLMLNPGRLNTKLENKKSDGLKPLC